MKLRQFFVYGIICLTPVFFSLNAVADEDKSITKKMTEEEIEDSIGRMGEVEEIPEDFEFSEAERKLWFADHLGNIEQPIRLYYEFEKSGTYEDGFTDSVFLDILELNKDGTKNANLDFFSADRQQYVSSNNVTNIRGNPVLGKFMDGDVREMNRLTEGHWRHFQKMIKIALRETAKVEPVNFKFNGQEVKGEKVVFSPYLEDPHRSDFEKFSEKRYEITFSDQVPGKLYQIKTTIPDKTSEEPLIREVLTLVEANTVN